MKIKEKGGMTRGKWSQQENVNIEFELPTCPEAVSILGQGGRNEAF